MRQSKKAVYVRPLTNRRHLKVLTFTFKALYTLNIFTHNIAIKRYCNKKDNFEPWMSKGQGKLLTNHKSRYFMFR